jgi:hypothetical protein
VAEEKVRGNVREDEGVRCWKQVCLRGAVNGCLRRGEGDWSAVTQQRLQTQAVHVTSALRRVKSTSILGVK